jgi:transposase InsO family protein
MGHTIGWQTPGAIDQTQRLAIAEFRERYNLRWRPEKMGFMSPVEVRQAYAM